MRSEVPRLSFAFDLEDVLDVHRRSREIAAHAKALRANRLRQASRSGMLVGAWVVLLELLLRGREFRISALVPAAIAAVLSTAVAFWWSAIANDPRRPAGRRRLAAAVAEAHGPEPWICEVFVDDEGLRAEQCGAIAVLPWGPGFEVHEDGEDVVATSAGQLLVVRGRAFANEADRRAFVAELVRRRGA